MDKTKKRFILCSVVSAVLLGGVGVVVNQKGEKAPLPDQGGLDITPVAGIRFDSVRYVQNTNNIQKIVTYTLTPSNVKDVHFDTVLDFVHTDDAEWDWTYDGTKKPEEYMKVDVDSSKCTLTFTCLKPFGTRMFFDMIYPENPAIQARLLMDYDRKVIQDATTLVSATAFKTGVGIQVLGTSAVYSIGTKGRRQDEITYNVAFDEGGQTLKSLLGTPKNPSTLYPTTYRYNGTDYNQTTILTAMTSAIDAYFKSCITQTGETLFDAAQLRKLLTFEYATYHDYMDHYGSSSTIYYQFIDNYVTNYQKGYGYKATISINGSEVKSQVFGLDIPKALLTNIQVEGDIHLTF